MTEKEFLTKMIDILDYDGELSMSMALQDIEEWDSLSILTFLAEMGRYSSIKVDDVKQAKTIENLYQLIKQ